MSVHGLVAFNVLLNGVGSFAIAWLVASLAARLFRGRVGASAGVAFAALPFAKIVFDAASGIPERSFLWQRARGVPQDLGSFQIGFGLDWGVPKIQLAFGALWADQTYTQSAPDLVAGLLMQRVAPWAPAIVAAALFAFGALFFGRRLITTLQAATEARALRRKEPVRIARAGRLAIPVFVADVDGSPYMGGLLRPFIVFPRTVWTELSEGERAAAILHELGHIAYHHLAIVTIAGVVSDFFWFVPGIRSALRRLRSNIEIAADRWAVAAGAPPLLLASALVRVKELSGDIATSPSRLSVVDASLPERVAQLVATADAPVRATSRARRIAGYVAVLWTGATVFTALAFGNH